MSQAQDPDVVWHTCCSKTERGFVKFIVQVTVAVLIIVFSMYMIANGTDNREIYFSMLSGTAGVFLPTPTITPDRRHPVVSSIERRPSEAFLRDPTAEAPSQLH